VLKGINYNSDLFPTEIATVSAAQDNVFVNEVSLTLEEIFYIWPRGFFLPSDIFIPSTTMLRKLTQDTL
jgi:hypothetical protein